MNDQLYDYDPAEALTTPEAVAEFLAGAFETGDAEHITSALAVVARAKGMAEVAAGAGIERANLYKTLNGQRSPNLKTLLAVTRSLGMDLTIRPHVAG